MENMTRVIIGFLILVVAGSVGVILTVNTGVALYLFHGLAFGFTFLFVTFLSRDFDQEETPIVFTLSTLIAVLVCLITIVFPVNLMSDTLVEELIPDAIYRSAELGNRVTAIVGERVVTTTRGEVWILEDSDIVIRHEQDVNGYLQYLNDPRISLGQKSETNIVDNVSE